MKKRQCQETLWTEANAAVFTKCVQGISKICTRYFHRDKYVSAWEEDRCGNKGFYWITRQERTVHAAVKLPYSL